jgi:hypothetical protein
MVLAGEGDGETEGVTIVTGNGVGVVSAHS